MAVFIALLRAVNVGGTGKLPMQELRRACEEAGLSRVATYIASGNLVFGCDKSAKGAKSIMEDVLRLGFGLTRNHVLIRTQGELARVIAANPFPQAAAERPNWLVVNFLDGEADAGAAERLGAYEGPERMRLAGNHLYLDYPQGLGRSKLTAAFLDKALKLPSTARNWNTTNKLLAMARELEG
jgi:uncharacterized protein (DUF1697 family)